MRKNCTKTNDVLSDLNNSWPPATTTNQLLGTSNLTRPDDEKRPVKQPRKHSNNNDDDDNTNNNNQNNSSHRNRKNDVSLESFPESSERRKSASASIMESVGPRNTQTWPSKAAEGLWADKQAGGGGEGLKLEYMDLDEFLMENAMTLTEGGDSNQGSESGSVNSRTGEPASHSHPYGTRVSSSRRSLGSDGCSGGGSISGGSTGSGSTGAQSDDDNDNDTTKRAQGLDFNPGPSRKNRKTFVPDHCKDERYWQRRRKNNMAAKRSRDARRVKENQIAIRANYLEVENEKLKEQLKILRQENLTLRSQVAAKGDNADHVAQ